MNPVTGRPEGDKVSLPLRGTGVTIAERLHDITERRDKLELANYNQKLEAQQTSIKMLMEEERVINEAN